MHVAAGAGPRHVEMLGHCNREMMLHTKCQSCLGQSRLVETYYCGVEYLVQFQRVSSKVKVVVASMGKVLQPVLGACISGLCVFFVVDREA